MSNQKGRMSENKDDLNQVTIIIKEVLGFLSLENVSQASSQNISERGELINSEDDLALIKFEVLLNYAKENVNLFKCETNPLFHQLCAFIIKEFYKFLNANEIEKQSTANNEAMVSKYLQFIHILCNSYSLVY